MVKNSKLSALTIALVLSACGVGGAPVVPAGGEAAPVAQPSAAAAGAKPETRTSYTLQATDYEGKPQTYKMQTITEIPAPETDLRRTTMDSTPERNMMTNAELRGSRVFPTAADRGNLENRMRPKSTRTLQVSLTDSYEGTLIKEITPAYNNAQLGVYGSHQVVPTLELGPTSWGDWQRLLYAPTVMPPNNTAVEMCTVYERYWAYNGTDRFWGVFNHNTPGWAYTQSMDSTFMSNYVRTYNGIEKYFFQILKDGGTNTQRVYLYNFNTSSWEQKVVLTEYKYWGGTGWDIHERALRSSCVTVPGIVADNLAVYNGSSWTDLRAYPVFNADLIGYLPNQCGFTTTFPNGVWEHYYWWSGN